MWDREGIPEKGAEAGAPSVKAMLNRLEEPLDSLHLASCCPAPCLGGLAQWQWTLINNHVIVLSATEEAEKVAVPRAQ